MAASFDSLRARLWALTCEESFPEAALLERFLLELGAGLGAAEAVLSDGFAREYRWRASGRSPAASVATALGQEAHQSLKDDRPFTFRSAALGAEMAGCAYRVLGQVAGAFALARPQPWPEEPVAFLAEAAEILAKALSRRKVESDLRQSELRYRIVSELCAQYTFSATVQPDGRAALDWFTGIRHVVGGEQGELATLSDRLAQLSPEGRAVAHQVLQRCLKTNAPASGRFPVHRRGEAERWLRIDMRPVANAVDKRLTRVFAAVRDETEQVAAQLELEKERDHWRDLVQAAPVGISSLSLDGALLDCNPAGCTLLGAKDESELVGKPVTGMAPPNDAERSKPLLAQVRAGHPLKGVRWTGRALDGLEIPVDVWVGLTSDRDGRPAFFSGVVVPVRPNRPGEVDATEFGDLVSAILGNAGLALAALEGDSPARQDLLQVIAAAERTAALLRRPSARQDTPRPRPRVALVDAEELVRRAAGTILERDGYDVVPFASPTEAVDALGPALGELTALVLDVRAPEAEAVAALAELRARRKDLPVLVTSSLPQPAIATGGRTVLLHKPYSREQLLAALARAVCAEA